MKKTPDEESGGPILTHSKSHTPVPTAQIDRPVPLPPEPPDE